MTGPPRIRLVVLDVDGTLLTSDARLTPARVLGLDDRLGSLEPGKHATLCIWSGDPLDARSRVEAAWIEGRQVYGADPDRPPF